MDTYQAVIAGIKKDTIKATLTKDGIETSLISKAGKVIETNLFNYDDIISINLTPIDINRRQLTIEIQGGKKLKLVSRSFGMAQPDGSIKRTDIDQFEEFKIWLKQLHVYILKKCPLNDIIFSTGSTTKIIILSALLVFAVLAIFLALSIKKYGAAATLAGGVVLISSLIYKMGFKKTYEPELLPAEYQL